MPVGGDEPAAIVADDILRLEHEPGLLGHRDEGHRRDRPAPRVVPPHQRFGPADDAGGQLDLGLEADVQAVDLERFAQVGGEGEATRRRRVVAGVVELPPAATPAGRVGGDVGALDQRWHVDGLLGVHGDADAALDVEADVVDDERLLEGADEPLGERRGRLDRRHVVREQQRAPNPGVERGALSTEAQMPPHRVDVHSTQRVVDVGVVLASKLSTVHAARRVG